MATAMDRLRYHVTGAIERGEAQPIIGMPAKSPGQVAYEEDCRRRPTYHTGQPRRAWHELDNEVRHNWEKSPTPRNWES